MKKILILLFILVLKIQAYYPFTDDIGYANCQCDSNESIHGADFPYKWIVIQDIDENKDIISSDGNYNYELRTCMDQSSRSITKSKVISDVIPVSLIYPKTWAFTISYQNHTEICSCGVDDSSFPPEEDNYRYFTVYSSNETYKNNCLNYYYGIIETRIYSCRIYQRCKYCQEPSDPTPPPPEDTNTTHWELIDEISCENKDDNLTGRCTNANATDVLVQT
jgi:hypothetical protein